MFYSGLLTVGAGHFLALIRTYLLAQGWTSLGTIATNHEVFHSTGESGTEDIIIAIYNVSSGHVHFRAATAYNNDTKILSNPTTPRYIQLHTTASMPYWLFIKKDFFIAVVKNYNGSWPYALAYCGLLNRYDQTDTYCIICSGSTTPTGQPVGIRHYNNFAYYFCQLLQDHVGNFDKGLCGVAVNACFYDDMLPNPVDGKLIISPILAASYPPAIHGSMIDVFSLKNAVIASEDIFLKNGDEYICFIIGDAKCAIKK